MTSSIALWYEQTQDPAKGERAKVEVHFNLWRHLVKKEESNFLDVGLLVENGDEIKTLNLFLPIAFDSTEVIDLSKVLNDDKLLSGVFNDVVKFGAEIPPNSFTAESKGKHFLTFHGVDRDHDVARIDYDGGEAECGFQLTFNAEFCRRLHGPGKHYIRLRFLLSDAAATAFSTKRGGEGGILVSTLWYEEFTELRFNEMRNVPKLVIARMEEPASKLFNVTAAHCFIIRDLSFEHVASHGAMQKMRRMEAHLWNGYLPKNLSGINIGNMMIYHWRANSAPVDNFVSLARFRAPTNNFWYYVAGVVLLGGLGSALEDFLSSRHWVGYADESGAIADGGVWAGLEIAGIILVCVFLFARTRSSIWHQTKSFFKSLGGK